MTDRISRSENKPGTGADSATSPLRIEENALFGLAAEEDMTRYEAALRSQLAGTLRALLADRLVKAPTEEFEAVKLPGKEKLREARQQRTPTPRTARHAENKWPKHMREARSRLGDSDSGGKSSGKRE